MKRDPKIPGRDDAIIMDAPIGAGISRERYHETISAYHDAMDEVERITKMWDQQKEMYHAADNRAHLLQQQLGHAMERVQSLEKQNAQLTESLHVALTKGQA